MSLDRSNLRNAVKIQVHEASGVMLGLANDPVRDRSAKGFRVYLCCGRTPAHQVEMARASSTPFLSPTLLVRKLWA